MHIIFIVNEYDVFRLIVYYC